MRERQRDCICVCVREGGCERENVCVCVHVLCLKEGECVCVREYVCLCTYEGGCERGSGCVREKEYVSVWVCAYVWVLKHFCARNKFMMV